MRKVFLFLTVAMVAGMIASCSSKLGELSADNFTVTPNPLEVQAGIVPTHIAGIFPEGYLKKKAVITVTPELRYGNGEVAQGKSATFQGEKVVGNNQTISYRLGGRYTMSTGFTYVPPMQKSDLYLTFYAKVGSKECTVPEVKVAIGVIATEQLYRRTILADGGCFALDSFQRITQQKQEANIKFLVNQANIRKSELESNSVQDFVAMLHQINDDQERLNLQNVEIQAYASPEGGFEFNNKLSAERQTSTEDYLSTTLKGTDLQPDVDAHYTAQDWEGFKALVEVSDIQDKDVIIRVLEMYSDPEEREQQIRNMSEGFQELATGILPELRRSRLIINYEVVGRSDEQLVQQIQDDPSVLTLEELLYAATLVDSNEAKGAIYKKATEMYPNDARAYNNLASIAMRSGDLATAKTCIDKAIEVNPAQAEAYANRGLLELIAGDTESAQADIAKATTLGDVTYAQGVLDLSQGNYAAAVVELKENTNSAALAQLLAKDYDAATTTLDNAENKDAINSYLHAIVAARQDNKYAANSYLKEAIEKDPAIAAYADNDLELSLLN